MSDTAEPVEKPKHRWYQYASVALIAALLVAADKKPEKAPSAAQIQKWVKQLGNDDFKVREEATRNLINAGGAAFDAVRKATKSKEAEVRQRAGRIIKHPEKVAKQKEKAAIVYFKRLDSQFGFDENSPAKPVVELYLSETDVTDAGLVHLKGLTKLQELFLDNTKITDAGLEHLKVLTGLAWLRLRRTKVTDARLEHLNGLTILQVLSLDDNKITDAGLEHLKGLASLRKLTLVKTKVTQAGIKKLRMALPKCIIKWDGK